jgi:hypothetical protein
MLAGVLAALAPTAAGADPIPFAAGHDTVEVPPEPPRTYVNLRIGATVPSTDGRAQVCLEVEPLAAASVEMCGTGSGFLHSDPDPALMHARVKLRLASWHLRHGHLQPSAMLGIAELQIGEDTAGFHFRGTGPYGNETAGLDAGASLRWLMPLAGDVEAIAELQLSLAYLPHAPDLIEPMRAWQPVLGFTFGVGF